jgi:hypothetical protein
MSEHGWKPLSRTTLPTVTRVLRSPTFLHARDRSASIVESPTELRDLAARVEALDQSRPPLSAVADRVAAAVRLLRATAARLEESSAAGSAVRPPTPQPGPAPSSSAGSAARTRLVVATLLYLVTPDDLVPDFRVGGYFDDVLVLSWVFGAACKELEPYLADEGLAEETTP